MNDLKCPICQSTDIAVERFNPDDHGLCYYTHYKCRNCGKQTDAEKWETLTKTEKLTVENQRLTAEVERLKAELEKQIPDRSDEGYVGFMLGVDIMKKSLAEKDAELEELRYIVEQFFNDWYCEDGCPKQKDKNFPCYGEEENETTAEFYPGECSFYQTKCWVEYYRWKFRQMKKARGQNGN